MKDIGITIEDPILDHMKQFIEKHSLDAEQLAEILKKEWSNYI